MAFSEYINFQRNLIVYSQKLINDVKKRGESYISNYCSRFSGIFFLFFTSCNLAAVCQSTEPDYNLNPWSAFTSKSRQGQQPRTKDTRWLKFKSQIYIWDLDIRAKFFVEKMVDTQYTQGTHSTKIGADKSAENTPNDPKLICPNCLPKP